MKEDLSVPERLTLWAALEESVIFLPTMNKMNVDDGASEALIEEKQEQAIFSHRRRQSCARYELVLPWSLAFVFFCSTLFFALRDSLAVRERPPSFEYGFSTDFVSSSPSIPLRIIKKKFTNDLLYNTTSKSLYNQPLNSNETVYIGEPTPAIDEAWHKLLHAQYIALEQGEVTQIPLDHIAPIWWNGQHNFIELSVFHNLHCLNEIRIALDHEDHAHVSGDWMHQDRTHLDHCIDQIRQSLQCHSDLTPVPMKPLAGGPQDAALGNGEEHTCRDFDAIWAWVEERGRKHQALGDKSA